MHAAQGAGLDVWGAVQAECPGRGDCLPGCHRLQVSCMARWSGLPHGAGCHATRHLLVPRGTQPPMGLGPGCRVSTSAAGAAGRGGCPINDSLPGGKLWDGSWLGFLRAWHHACRAPRPLLGRQAGGVLPRMQAGMCVESCADSGARLPHVWSPAGELLWRLPSPHQFSRQASQRSMCGPCRASQEPPSSALMLRLVEELSNRQQLLAMWHSVHSSVYDLLVRLLLCRWLPGVASLGQCALCNSQFAASSEWYLTGWHLVESRQHPSIVSSGLSL